ncbi:hypothetical protein OK016_20565 [Vibrio chagasii]|nr:hypothetical protein [Vibrio chagasii]
MALTPAELWQEEFVPKPERSTQPRRAAQFESQSWRTLNEEERFMINDHIIQTFTMLNKLPLPNLLPAKYSEIASGHHRMH